MKHNQLTSSELLSNDRRAVGFVSSVPRFSEAGFSLINSATFSFLALLVNQINYFKNLKIAKLKKSFQISHWKR